MHTYNIMKMCTAAIDVYGKDLIDGDLLLTGAFCHDLALVSLISHRVAVMQQPFLSL